MVAKNGLERPSQSLANQQKITRLKVGSIVQAQFEAASGAKQTIHQVNKVVLQCSAHCDTSTSLRPNAASIASLMRPHQAGPLQGKGRKVIKSMHALVIPVMVLIQTRGYQMQSRISLLELFVVCSDMSQQKKNAKHVLLPQLVSAISNNNPRNPNHDRRVPAWQFLLHGLGTTTPNHRIAPASKRGRKTSTMTTPMAAMAVPFPSQ